MSYVKLGGKKVRCTVRCFCSVTPRGWGAVWRGEGGRAQRTSFEWDDGCSLRAHCGRLTGLRTVRSLPPRERVQRAGPRALPNPRGSRRLFSFSFGDSYHTVFVKSPCVSSPRLADDLMSDSTCHTSSTCFLGERDDRTACLFVCGAVNTNRAPLLRSASRMACKITCGGDGRRGLLHSRSNAGARKRTSGVVPRQLRKVQCGVSKEG